MINIGIEFVDAIDQSGQASHASQSNVFTDVLGSVSNATGDTTFPIIACILILLSLSCLGLYFYKKSSAYNARHLPNGSSYSSSSSILNNYQNLFNKKTLLVCAISMMVISLFLFVLSFCGHAFADNNDLTTRNPVNLTSPSKIKAYVNKDLNTVTFDNLTLSNPDASTAFVNLVGLSQTYGDEDKSTWTISSQDKNIYNGPVNDLYVIDDVLEIGPGLSEDFTINTNMSVDFATSLIGYDNAYCLSFLAEDLPNGYDYANEPLIDKTCTYNGSEQSPISYDETITLTGDISATDASTYNFFATPNDGYVWDDLTTTPRQYSWTILKAEPTLNVDESIDASVGVDASISYSYYGDGQISVKSSDESVVKVSSYDNNSIKVTPVSAGCADIIINFTAGNNYNAISKSTHVVVSQNFTGTMSYPLDDEGNDKIINISFGWNPCGIVNADNNQYNKEIAVLGSIIIGDFYKDTRVTIDGYDQWDKTDNKSLFTNVLGMSDVEEIYLDPSDYTYDTDDVSSFLIMHKPMYDNGVKKELIIIACKGTTTGSLAEWSSDFDVGNTSDAYMAYDHPEWTNKNNHKGFDVILNRFIPKIKTYLDTHIDREDQINILLTGHSKGGSTSHLLGREITASHPNYKTFAYSFATAAPSIVDGSEKYDNLFLISNYDDSVCCMPPSNWGFSYYGKEIGLDASSDERFLATWNELVGEDCPYQSGAGKEIKAMFNDPSFPSQSNFYNFYTDPSCVYVTEYEYESDQSAITEFYNRYIQKYKLDKYNKYELFCNDDGYWNYKITLTPSFFSQTLADMTALAESDQKELFNFSENILPIIGAMPQGIQDCLALFSEHAYGVVYAHSTFAYYIIANQ